MHQIILHTMPPEILGQVSTCSSIWPIHGPIHFKRGTADINMCMPCTKKTWILKITWFSLYLLQKKMSSEKNFSSWIPSYRTNQKKVFLERTYTFIWYHTFRIWQIKKSCLFKKFGWTLNCVSGWQLECPVTSGMQCTSKCILCHMFWTLLRECQIPHQ